MKMLSLVLFIFHQSTHGTNQIENKYLSFSTRYNNVALIGDFNSRTSIDSDFFNFDEKDPSDILSDFVENNVNILDHLGIPRDRKNKDLARNRFIFVRFLQGK